ncbi:MAG: tyrosine-type recombinase/integrase [Vulcanimicrobiota bacterium]
MKRLLELPNRSTVLGLRDQFVLELLYSLGPRRSECSALNLSDLDLDQQTLRVVGKGGDERLLPVSPSLELCAQDYLCNSRPELVADTAEQALFLNQRKQRLSDQSVNLIVRKYGLKLGLNLSAHQLRHACATHLVEAGMELEHIQQILGHANLDSTRRYAQVSQRQLEREFRRCWPRTQNSFP